MNLLDLIVGSKNDPAALAAGIEQYVAAEIAQAKADLDAALAQANTDAAAREAQLFAGVSAALAEVKAIVAPFAGLVERMDGATVTSTLKLGGK